MASMEAAEPDRTVAKRLFEIRWNDEHNWHEVELYPCVYPPSLNGRRLVEGEPTPLLIGDVITIGPFRMEYAAQPQRDGHVEA